MVTRYRARPGGFFNLIVVDASPGRNTPFRLVLYRDADIARTLEGMTRATVAKARKALQACGYIRLIKTRAWWLYLDSSRARCCSNWNFDDYG